MQFAMFGCVCLIAAGLNSASFAQQPEAKRGEPASGWAPQQPPKDGDAQRDNQPPPMGDPGFFEDNRPPRPPQNQGWDDGMRPRGGDRGEMRRGEMRPDDQPPGPPRMNRGAGPQGERRHARGKHGGGAVHGGRGFHRGMMRGGEPEMRGFDDRGRGFARGQGFGDLQARRFGRRGFAGPMMHPLRGAMRGPRFSGMQGPRERGFGPMRGDRGGEFGGMRFGPQRGPQGRGFDGPPPPRNDRFGDRRGPQRRGFRQQDDFGPRDMPPAPPMREPWRGNDSMEGRPGEMPPPRFRPDNRDDQSQFAPPPRQQGPGMMRQRMRDPLHEPGFDGEGQEDVDRPRAPQPPPPPPSNSGNQNGEDI